MATPRRNSILGRRRKIAPTTTPSLDGALLLRHQLSGPDPVRRTLAREAMQPRPAYRLADRPPACRYCGHRVVDRSQPICTNCEAPRGEWEARAMGRSALTDRRGWVGPALFEPEEFLLRRLKQLRDLDHARIHENEKRTRKARRAAKATRTTHTSATPSNAPDNPQKSWGPEADPNPPIRLARRAS
jgi:hypothetical protein